VAAQRAPISFLIGLSVVLFALSPKVVYSDPIDIRAAPPTQAGPPAGTGNIAQVVRDHSIAVIAQGSVTINYTTQEQDAKLRSSQTVLRQEINAPGQRGAYAALRLALVNAEIERPELTHRRNVSIFSAIADFIVSPAAASGGSRLDRALDGLKVGQIAQAAELLNDICKEQNIPTPIRAQARFYGGLINEFIEFKIVDARLEYSMAYELDTQPAYANALARADLGLGRIEEAERYYRLAAAAPAMAGARGTSQLQFNAQLGLGWIEIQQSDWQAAIKRADLILNAPRAGDLPTEALPAMMELRAVARWKSGATEEAEADFRNAIAALERLNKVELRELIAEAYNAYAGMLTEQYRLGEAEEQYGKALGSLNEGVPNGTSDASTLAATIWSNESILLKNEGQFDKAIRWASAALEVLVRSYDYDDLRVALALKNEAAAYCRQGAMVQALPVIEQAIGVIKRTNNADSPAEADALSIRGYIEESLDQKPLAKKDFEAALKIRTARYGNISMPSVKSLTNLGVLYLSSNDLTDADIVLKRAVSILDSIPQPDWRFAKLTFTTWEKVLDRAGDKAEAANYHSRASAIPGETMDCAR